MSTQTPGKMIFVKQNSSSLYTEGAFPGLDVTRICAALFPGGHLSHTHFSNNMYSSRDKDKPSTELRGPGRQAARADHRQPGQPIPVLQRNRPQSPLVPQHGTLGLQGRAMLYCALRSVPYDSNAFCFALPLLLIHILTGHQCRAHVSQQLYT